MHLPLAGKNINNPKENSLRIMEKVLGPNILKLVFCGVPLPSIMHKSCNVFHLISVFWKNNRSFKQRVGNIKNNFYRRPHLFIRPKLKLILLCLATQSIIKLTNQQVANQMLLLLACTEFLWHETVALQVPPSLSWSHSDTAETLGRCTASPHLYVLCKYCVLQILWYFVCKHVQIGVFTSACVYTDMCGYTCSAW